MASDEGDDILAYDEEEDLPPPPTIPPGVVPIKLEIGRPSQMPPIRSAVGPPSQPTAIRAEVGLRSQLPLNRPEVGRPSQPTAIRPEVGQSSELPPDRADVGRPSQQTTIRAEEGRPSQPTPAVSGSINPDIREKGRNKRPEMTIMKRPGYGKNGNSIVLLSNHFYVTVGKFDAKFYHYSVQINYKDGTPVEGTGIGRKVIRELYKTYDDEFSQPSAYDGEKSLFTINKLPNNINVYEVFVLEIVAAKIPLDRAQANVSPDHPNKRLKAEKSKTFDVILSYAAEVPMRAIAQALRGGVSDQSPEALRVLDIILRQNAANQGCLLVRQSFFRHIPSFYVDIGDGINGLRGFHSSFRLIQGSNQQGRLSLNMDVSTTMIVKPVLLINFIFENQKVRHYREVNWFKAIQIIKGLRVELTHTKQEGKIVGLSPEFCHNQFFNMKKKIGTDANGNPQFFEEEISVANYFGKYRILPLEEYSKNVPCIDVGKRNRPIYVPIEFCKLLPLQRYTKSLSTSQRSNLVLKSRQGPQDRLNNLREERNHNNYDHEPMLRELDMAIQKDVAHVTGRILKPPKLRAGNGLITPGNGRWNLNKQTLFQPVPISWWAVADFSSKCNNIKHLVNGLRECGRDKGIKMEYPFGIAVEDANMARESPAKRVAEMIKKLESMTNKPPEFILCLLEERKNSPIYGPWKKRFLTDMGIATQCLVPKGAKLNDQYYTNVLLKINAKLGGINYLLEDGLESISHQPTIILGMDVSHGQPGQDIPSIAAVVGSCDWPHVTKYRASVRAQSPKEEMIQSLFKLEYREENGKTISEDKGIIRELLQNLSASGALRPKQFVIFRDGVSESQFNQVLNTELSQIMDACETFNSGWRPNFTVIVAQKNHHTRFFQNNQSKNVPPGTIVDTTVCHPRNYDFYMCAQAGMIGTTRPTHYHVLLDEIGFTPDMLQEFIHSLSYIYQRSTTAVSVVAPICYAHLAATQAGQFIKFEDLERSESGNVNIPKLPVPKTKAGDNMYFC